MAWRTAVTHAYLPEPARVNWRGSNDEFLRDRAQPAFLEGKPFLLDCNTLSA
jgi:hypothetical protein